ncbi:GGDEF domain-containing protein [Oryzifoliimicrobium ureilyticus]|uniref:GGDEF domain-containing protein n=1 Tax=Oryzifoliimicrobium ureilyticus TaxID=3113724 RepID=UPI0030762822
MDLNTFVISSVRILGQAAIIVYIYAVVVRTIGRPLLRRFTIGLLFGTGGVLSMSDPITWMPGIIHDGRLVLAVLAPAYGGGLAAIVAAAMMGSYRLFIGGAGAPGGAVGVALVTLAGYMLTLLPVRFLGAGHRRTALYALATLSGAAVIPFLPRDIAYQVLTHALAPLFVINVVGVFLLSDLLDRERYRIRIQRALENEASVDPLTKLPNRRVLQRAGDRCAAEMQTKQTPFSVVMLDIDHFKKINDTWGHSVGDTVLSGAADVIRASVRRTDIAARYGGEEIVVLLPNTDDRQAAIVGEKIRQGVATNSVAAGDEQIKITVSIGIASSLTSPPDFQNVLDAADRALYRAKQSGRNRVEIEVVA